MPGVAVYNYFQKNWLGLDDTSLIIRDQVNGVRHGQKFDALRLRVLLGPPHCSHRRLGVDATRDPPLIESAFAPKDRVNRNAGLRACGAVQQTDSVHVAHSVKPGSRESHLLVYFEK